MALELAVRRNCSQCLFVLCVLLLGNESSGDMLGQFRPVDLDEDDQGGEGGVPVGATGHTLVRRRSSLWMYGGLIEWKVDSKNEAENSVRYGHALWQFEPNEMVWHRVVASGAPRTNIKQHEKLELEYDNEMVLGKVVTPRTKHDQIEVEIDFFGKPKNVLIDRTDVIYHPPAMQMHVAVVSPDDKMMYVHPGKGPTGHSITELWSYSFDREVWTQVHWSANSEVPARREMHSGVTLGRGLLVFGGVQNQKIFQDLWHFPFGGDRWRKITTKGTLTPPPLWGHSAVVYDNHMWVFGGSSGLSKVTNHLFTFDWKAREWHDHTVQTTGGKDALGLPSPRKGHSAHVYNHCMIVYGGHDSGANFFSDLWLLDLTTVSWSKVTLLGKKPKGRNFHSASVWHSTLFIHGGNCDYGILNDFWSIDLAHFCK